MARVSGARRAAHVSRNEIRPRACAFEGRLLFTEIIYARTHVQEIDI